MKKYIAYYCEDNELEYFDTKEAAEKWLQDLYSDGECYSEETISGGDFIGEITHISHYNITDKKEDYHEHTDECHEDCCEEEWPYDCDYDTIGKISFEPIDKEKS